MGVFYTIIDNEGYTVDYSSDELNSYLSRVSLNNCVLYRDDEEAKMDIYNIELEWENGQLNSINAVFPLRLAKVENTRRLIEM